MFLFVNFLLPIWGILYLLLPSCHEAVGTVIIEENIMIFCLWYWGHRVMTFNIKTVPLIICSIESNYSIILAHHFKCPNLRIHLIQCPRLSLLLYYLVMLCTYHLFNLQQATKCLSELDQSPPASVLEAMQPFLNAIVKPVLLMVHHLEGELSFWRPLQNIGHVLWCWILNVMI